MPRFLPYRLELADGSVPVSASRPAADEIPARELPPPPPPPLSLLVADERALEKAGRKRPRPSSQQSARNERQEVGCVSHTA